LPVLANSDDAASFTLTNTTAVIVGPGASVASVGADLAALLRPATGFPLPVETGNPRAGAINLRLIDDPLIGSEGYDLAVRREGITLSANTAAGLFHAVQTVRQLLPASVEARSVRPGPWRVEGGRIVDYPRFGYRGAMLDVARHFFTVGDVERYIDELAAYKVNVLHLHLSDDQGWRIAIDGWPRLTAIGGRTEVGSLTGGGYYTKADYTAIVRYAQAHFITVVPEIDMPGHVGAALHAYAELNCDKAARPPSIGEHVGFSSLCVGKPITRQFVDDVVGELAALTPGPYIHLGGDEARATSASGYVQFVQQAQAIVRAHGKQLMGWGDIARAKLDPGTVAEYWNFADGGANTAAATHQGVGVVAAPANRAYLDQKYTPATSLGLDWAGDIEVADAYSWDPADLIAQDSGAHLLGVEAPLWSETTRTMSDVEYLAWPRMAGIAEIGWTPRAERDWTSYAPRLARQALRWKSLGINFYRSPQVRWAS
jgi:hexosaminidase